MAAQKSQKPGGHRRKPSTESHIKSIAETEVFQTDTTDETPIKTAPWRSLFAFSTRRFLPVLIAGIIVSLAAGATGPAQNLIAGELFEGFTLFASGSVTPDELMKRETKYILYMVALAGASWVLHSLEFMLWLSFGELQAASARDRLFHGLMAKETEWYDLRKNGIGAQLPRMQAQIRELQLATAQPLGGLFALASTAVLSFIQAMVKSPKLTLVTLASAPLILGFAVWAGVPMQVNLIKMQDKLTEGQKYTTSAFTAIETVKCFNGQEIEAAKYKGIIKQAARFYAWVAHGSALQMALVVMLTVSMFVQGFYYGGVLIAKGEVTSGDVVTTFFSAIGAFQAIQGILPQMIVLEKGRAAGSTLRAIMAQVESKSKHIPQEPITPSKCIGNIEVKNLTFAYPSRPDVPAVQDITLYIQGGDISFLIGKSGSGKSTISQLLMRFYNAPADTITVDGIPLERLDTTWLRSNVTLVEQTSTLFNETVFRNIAFGRKDHVGVTKKDVMDAAQFALLQLMISDMPEGLDTMVGVKGGAMSGGQGQRMALARARLRDTPILILDESTSALDHISRSLVMEALRNWRKGKTTIIITHDITQIMAEDYVYLLQDGRLAQEGYRKQLEKVRDGPFQDFLSEEQKMLASSAGVQDVDLNDRDSWTLDLSDESPEPLPQNQDTYFDPLDVELTATENKRQSKMPNVFKEGTPMPMMKGVNQGGPSSAFASPFMRVTVNFPTPDLISMPWTRSPQAVEDAQQSASDRESSADKRSTLTWERLVDQTGKYAADMRRARPGTVRKRRPLEDIEEIPLTGPDEALVTLEGQSTAQVERKNNTFKVIFGTLWPSLDRKAKSQFFLGFWGCTVHAVASPLFSFILSKLLATYALPNQQSKQLTYAMVILAVAFVDGFHTYAFRFLLEWVGQKWVDNIRTTAYERILDQEREFFNKDENGIAILTESLDRNAEEMRNLLGRFASMAYVVVMMTLITLVWAMASQWKVTLIALAVGPYIFGVTKAFASISEKWEGRSNDASDKASAIFTETFVNIKTVRALTLEGHFLEKYTKATNETLVVGFKRSFYAGFFYGLGDSAGNFSIALIFYVGTKFAAEGANINDIVTVFTMLVTTLTTVSAYLDYIPQIGSSKDTAARLLRLSQLPKSSHEHLGDTRISNVGDIIFDDLKFCYPSRPDQTILKNITLCLKPGTTTAIVGTSGSGKSTIANLLLDLYSTASVPGSHPGDLTFGGRDMKHISTTSLRTLIVPVSQVPTLFAATAAENISYGLPPTHPLNTPDHIAFAARQAGIHDFIASLPQAYATPIGEGGLGLSGGQAQRIAIARALIRTPSVLILDEATSALDVETANLIRHTIADLIAESKKTAHPMTVIIITHHRSMMEIAEKIVVVDNGTIVEEGEFDVLMRREGALANMLSGGEWMGERRGSRRVSRMERKRRSGVVPVLKEVDWSSRRDVEKGKGRMESSSKDNKRV
ncbi:putative Type 1 protein exporter [Septoria linicola]|nr:putative Type 1 protein exporter [Septoria linicola]